MAHGQPGLLLRFPQRCLPRRLPRVDVAAWLHPAADSLVPVQHRAARPGHDGRARDVDGVGVPAEGIGQPVQLGQEPRTRSDLPLCHRVEARHRFPQLAAVRALRRLLPESTRPIMPGPRAAAHPRSARMAACAGPVRPPRARRSSLALLMSGCGCDSDRAGHAGAAALGRALLRLRGQRPAPPCRPPAPSCRLRWPDPGAGEPGSSAAPSGPSSGRIPRRSPAGWRPPTAATSAIWSSPCRRRRQRRRRPGSPSSLGSSALRLGALAAWLATAIAGAYLLTAWLTRDRPAPRDQEARRARCGSARARRAGDHGPAHLDRVHGDENCRARVG